MPADINDLRALEKFFDFLLEGIGEEIPINELTKQLVEALRAGKAEVKPNMAFKLRPEDQEAKDTIMESLERTRPARLEANPLKPLGITEDQT